MNISALDFFKIFTLLKVLMFNPMVAACMSVIIFMDGIQHIYQESYWDFSLYTPEIVQSVIYFNAISLSVYFLGSLLWMYIAYRGVANCIVRPKTLTFEDK